MTKTLTEQWRDGTLPDGYYYIDYDTQQRIFEIEDGCATYQGLPAETYFLNDVCLIKVLAPVPSFDEHKQLVSKTEQLEKNLAGTEQAVQEGIEINEGLKAENKRLQEQKQKVIALIKDGRFVEALQELEK